MKKLLGILVLGLLWCNVGVAEIKIIEKIEASELAKTISPKAKAFPVIRLCVDGLEFVVVGHGAVGPSVSQVYELKPSKTYGQGITAPKECD